MDIVCPACGQTSQDPEFCDHCNGDLRGPAARPPLPSICPVTPAGVRLTPSEQAALGEPDTSLLLHTDEQGWRVHWIAQEALPVWSARLRERVAKNTLRCLAPARIVEEAGGAWVIVEAARGIFQPWASPLEDPQAEIERLLHFMSVFAETLEELHANGLVWLTFDPRHLEQSGQSQVRLTNLDLCVYPAGHCPERLPAKPSFAAPEIVRYHPEDVGPRTDVFHLAVLAYYWLAGLLPNGFSGEGLESFWYQLPKLRIYAPRLPLGIAGTLSQGMSVEPAQRHATPKAFAAALRTTVERSRARSDFPGPVRWDLGAHTCAGRTKAALGRDNEDHVLIHPFTNPDRALLAVADGITTCDVGSGALASLISIIVLESAFDATSTRENFAARITKACHHGAHTLLAWAVEKGYLPQLKAGADLMGTTLTAGWLEGNVLSVANLGDSRAYLIDKTGVEQLTVDGDLASGMLADGMPPENIRDVGPVAKALRECIGGCTLNAKGDIIVLEDSCTPTVTDWHLVPGDVIVLCSDGLVDEDTFMEPEMLGDIVRAHPQMSAKELALHLVEAADNLHRLPSPLEPEGYGDNISCVVIKIG